MTPWRRRLLAAHFDHLGGGVDGDDFLCALGEQQRKGSFAGAEIGDDHGRHEAQQRFGHALPRFAGNVILAQAAGDASQRKLRILSWRFLTTRRMAAWSAAASGISCLASVEQLVQNAPAGVWLESR